MLRFFNKLLRDFKTTGSARGGRGAPRRAALQVEGLEDRLVLSTASLVGSTLTVDASPGTFKVSRPGGPIIDVFRQITLEADKAQPGKLDVLDNGALLGRFSIAKIKDVNVNVAGLDTVTVDDSNGLPFAAGTSVSFAGKGSLNSLTLSGTGTVSGSEVYGAGFGAFGSLTLGGTSYSFTNAIGSVTDSVKITGSLLVQSDGSNVTLSGAVGGMQTLSGLSNGGAINTLNFSAKGFASLDMFLDNATASLKATTAAAGEQKFKVILTGNDETLNIDATPSSVATSVEADGNPEFVNILANSGSVSVVGSDTTTFVTLGQVAPTGGFVTSGIKGNVSVTGAKSLLVDDSGNRTTQEKVKVTESTVSGTGLFGNDAVKVSYSDTGLVGINTGLLAESYTVAGSHPGARFSSLIDIADGSQKGLAVTADLDGGSGLRMILLNNLQPQPAPASLFIEALGGTFNPTSPIIPTGSETVTFPGGLTSSVSYVNFTSVTDFSGVHRLPF